MSRGASGVVFVRARRRLSLAEAVLPEQAIEVDAIHARGARRRADAVLVLAKQLFEVPPLERADPGLARLAQRLADVHRALRSRDRRDRTTGAPRRREVVQRQTAFQIIA